MIERVNNAMVNNAMVNNAVAFKYSSLSVNQEQQNFIR